MTNDTKGKRGNKSQGSRRNASDEFAAGFEGVSSDLAGSGDDRRTSSFTGSGDDR